MLNELIEILSDQSAEISHERICQQLGISPGSLQSMLDILVRKGRLQPIIPEDGTCETGCQTCPALQKCALQSESQTGIYKLNA